MLLGRFLKIAVLTCLGFSLAYADTPTQNAPLVIAPNIIKEANQLEQAFIQEMVAKHDFKESALSNLLMNAEYNPDVIARILRPFEKKPWDFYRSYFINEKRIQDGATYWDEHTEALQQIADEFQVPPSIVIAIIGVESTYGSRTGTYPELSTLKTLAFYFPPRMRFFRQELEWFLLITRQNQLPPLAVKGSYAGALGIPQFMPSSYQHYGANIDRKPNVNLFTSHRDAIASVANYMHKEGWQWHQPVALRAIVPKHIPAELISKSARPKYTLAQLAKYGIRPAQPIHYTRKVALIELPGTQTSEYWIAFSNFRTIMHYNSSTSYAMAVFQLSQAIEKARDLAKQASATATTPKGSASTGIDMLEKAVEQPKQHLSHNNQEKACSLGSRILENANAKSVA